MLKRDSDGVLTAAQRAYLDEVHYAVVGTLNRDGSIQQTVVWFLRDGDDLRFSIGANSVKAANLRRNPAITLTVEDGRAGGEVMLLTMENQRRGLKMENRG